MLQKGNILRVSWPELVCKVQDYWPRPVAVWRA